MIKITLALGITTSLCLFSFNTQTTYASPILVGRSIQKRELTACKRPKTVIHDLATTIDLESVPEAIDLPTGPDTSDLAWDTLYEKALICVSDPKVDVPDHSTKEWSIAETFCSVETSHPEPIWDFDSWKKCVMTNQALDFKPGSNEEEQYLDMIKTNQAIRRGEKEKIQPFVGMQFGEDTLALSSMGDDFSMLGKQLSIVPEGRERLFTVLEYLRDMAKRSLEPTDKDAKGTQDANAVVEVADEDLPNSDMADWVVAYKEVAKDEEKYDTDFRSWLNTVAFDDTLERCERVFDKVMIPPSPFSPEDDAWWAKLYAQAQSCVFLKKVIITPDWSIAETFCSFPGKAAGLLDGAFSIEKFNAWKACVVMHSIMQRVKFLGLSDQVAEQVAFKDINAEQPLVLDTGNAELEKNRQDVVEITMNALGVQEEARKRWLDLKKNQQLVYTVITAAAGAAVVNKEQQKKEDAARNLYIQTQMRDVDNKNFVYNPDYWVEKAEQDQKSPVPNILTQQEGQGSPTGTGTRDRLRRFGERVLYTLAEAAKRQDKDGIRKIWKKSKPEVTKRMEDKAKAKAQKGKTE